MSISTTDAERRMQCVWLEDGLDELMGDATMFATAAALLAMRVSFLFWLAFVLLTVFGLPYGVRFYLRLKARVADPRVGYVRPRQSAYARWVGRLSQRAATLVFAGASVACAVVFQLIPDLLGFDLDRLLFPWITIAALTASPAYLAWRTGLRRFCLYALVPPVAEVAGRLAGLDDLSRFAAHLVGTGAVGLVAGGLALRGYLRRHPLPMMEKSAVATR